MTIPDTGAGGFGHLQLRAVLAEACTRAGLDATDATLLRGHTNAVVLLRKQPVVVKILRRGSATGSAVRTVRFVTWLQEQDFPTAPLLGGIEQPQIVDGHAATYWVHIPQDGLRVEAADLGRPLRQLHGLPVPPVPLPSIDPVTAIRRSLAAATVLEPDELALLHRRADELAAEYAELPEEQPDVVLHGDAQHRNALAAPGGTVLCDWDSAVIGPVAWDLVTVEIHCRRFGYPPAHLDAFAAAYGQDVRTWKGYPVYRGLRELRMITTNARKAAPSGTTLDEVRRRIRGLARHDTEQRWAIL